MSIVTRTGDDGTTGLMFGRRVLKTHPQVAAYGCVDELNAALGMVRAVGTQFPTMCSEVATMQRTLFTLMGELATLAEDLRRYQEKGFARLTSADVEQLDDIAARLEQSGKIALEGWDLPGNSPVSAYWHVARTVCRRAEREVLALREHGEEVPIFTVQFLNRLSDVCWLYARWVDLKPSPDPS